VRCRFRSPVATSCPLASPARLDLVIRPWQRPRSPRGFACFGQPRAQQPRSVSHARFAPALGLPRRFHVADGACIFALGSADSATRACFVWLLALRVTVLQPARVVLASFGTCSLDAALLALVRCVYAVQVRGILTAVGVRPRERPYSTEHLQRRNTPPLAGSLRPRARPAVH
jgi:hypothetical protein